MSQIGSPHNGRMDGNNASYFTDRERSLSVSPKTMPSRQLSHQDSIGSANSGVGGWRDHSTPSMRKQTRDSLFEEPSEVMSNQQHIHHGSTPHAGLSNGGSHGTPDRMAQGSRISSNATGGGNFQPPSLNTQTASGHGVSQPMRANESAQYPATLQHSISTQNEQPQSVFHIKSETASLSQERSMSHPHLAAEPATVTAQIASGAKRGAGSSIGSTSSAQQPARKKRRRDDIPIWARSIHGQKRPDVYKKSGTPAWSSPVANHTPTPQPKKSGPTSAHQNGILPQNGTSANPPSDNADRKGWELSITNKEPAEELSRTIADWLYLEIFGKHATVGVAGQAAPDEPVLEIEAKLGKMVWAGSEERMRMPILSEAIRDKGNLKFDANFLSSMTDVRYDSSLESMQQAMLIS